MKLFKVAVTIILTTLILLLGCAVAVELYLQNGVDEELKKQADQVAPFYWWTYTTHKGIELNSRWSRGPLKVALHPVLVYKNLPNQVHSAFSTNSRGYRGAEPDTHPTRPRIIMVGGSAAFGTGAQNDRETIGAYLETFLQAEVINAGVIGHASTQELVSLITEVIDLHPNLVITFDGFNDFYRPLEVSDPKDVRLLSSINGFEQIEGELQFLSQLKSPSFLARLSRSHLIFFPRIVERLKTSRVSFLWGKPTVPVTMSDRLSDGSIFLAAEIYAQNLRKMHRLSIACGYRFLPIIQPVKQKFKPEYRVFRQLSARHLSQAQIDVFDVADAEWITPDFFLDTVHLNAAGSKAVAQHVADFIRANHLLEPVHSISSAVSELGQGCY